jgi:hypothetical protein
VLALLAVGASTGSDDDALPLADGTRVLETLQPSDFEVLELGEAIPLAFECARTAF